LRAIRSKLKAFGTRHPRLSRIILFASLMGVAYALAMLPSHDSILSQLKQSRAIFGEGEIIASGGPLWPNLAPGETVYATINVSAHWTGEIQYRIAMRASAPIYEYDDECSDITISASPDGSDGSYRVLAGNCEEYGWTIIKKGLDWWEKDQKIYVRAEAGSPLSGGPHVFQWDVRVEPDIDYEAYAWEHSRDWLHILPWWLSITAFFWVIIYAVVKLPPHLRE